jgi:LacI family transcriptional regulator
MTGPAGIKDVAERAGVSVGTVSNVLNRPHLVRTETRERVEAAMADLAFVRNESARQLRAGSSRMMAYVFLDAENPFFIEVARGAEEACRDHGFSLIMCNSDDDRAREEDYLSLLLEQRVHGVLVSTAGECSARLRSLPALGVPVVLVDRVEANPQKWCTVGVDDVLGGRLAMRHLLAAGHRRIAFLGGGVNLPQVQSRLAGARLQVQEAGEPPDILSTVDTESTTVAAGRQAGKQIAAEPPGRRPTAVFCANDLLALGLLQELVRRRLRVPEDMAIVGFDDITFAEAAAVPLTSVRQPSRLIGRAAAELLLREAADSSHVHERILFEPELIVRESSGHHPS